MRLSPSLFPLLTFFLTTWVVPKPVDKHSEEPVPKNIVLIIGNGIGLSQISAGLYSINEPASLEKFNSIGIHKPYSSDHLNTDSASGATAFSCGAKTDNGRIAVDQDGLPLQTILEEAEQRGLATGLIASSSIVHSTPASFIAHNESRLNYEEIATDFLSTEIDFIVGGGRNYFDKRNSDQRDLIAELRDKEYRIENLLQSEINRVSLDPMQNVAFFISNGGASTASEDEAHLDRSVDLGLSHLSRHSSEGFFLMIQGPGASGDESVSNPTRELEKWQRLNEVINQVLEWSRQDGQTLVIVTADHEMGRLAIQQGSTLDSLSVRFTSKNPTGVMIPVFADGPGQDLFEGIYENTEIYHKMRQAYGW